MRDAHWAVGLAVLLASFVLGCDDAGHQKPVQVTVAGDAATIAAIERIVHQDPRIILPGCEIEYSFRFVNPGDSLDQPAPHQEPDAAIDSRMPIIRPDTTVGYSIAIVRPDTTIDYLMPIVAPGSLPRFSITILDPKPADTTATQTEKLARALSRRIHEGLGHLSR